MKFHFSDKEINFIQFCDNIEITTENDEVYIYNIAWTKNNRICLQYEDEPLIRELNFRDSKMTIHYVNGEIKEIENIKTITIDDNRFRRKYLFNIEGTLIKYTEDMAIKYNLDKELSYAIPNNTHIKKRTKNNSLS